MINEKTLAKLEYANVMGLVAQKTHSSYAANLVLNTKPQPKAIRVQELLQQTDEAIEYANNAVSPDFNFDDITELLNKARIASTLSMRELLCVMRLLKTSRLLYASVRSFRSEKVKLIIEIADGLYTDKNLEEQIDFCIISEEEMNDKASDTLFTIRKKIKKANAEIREKLQSYTRSKDLAPYLQESIVTLRGGRYVIPVKQEYKGFVKGLVHDQSASGSTVFIEPLAIVNLNNEIKTLFLEEAEEIDRILSEFTQAVGKISANLFKNQEIIASLDVIFARAEYALDCRGVKPLINEQGYLNLIRARHPLLNKDYTVPISVSIGKDYRVIVITGPNTGGKTVSLKTIGLFCLMAYSGLFLPADDGTEICCFDDIFVDIGDEQSIEQSLSTFSGHISNIKFISENVTNKSLVLLDELCAGTEPNEGSALAMAMTQYLLESKCRAVLTTHYGQLKEYSLVTEGVENACMEFNPATFAPTYKLVVGIPGSSNAIEIASRLGLPMSIIDSARSKLSVEKVMFEKVLQQAEQVRQDNEQQREEVAKMRAELTSQLQKAKNQNQLLLEEREKLLKKSQLEVRQVVREAQEQADNLIQQLKNMIKNADFDDSTLFKARSAVKQIGEINYTASKQQDEEDIFVGDQIPIGELKVGMSVYVKPFNSIGKIMSFDAKKNKVSVRIGNINSSVNASELYYSKEIVAKKVAPAHTQIKTQPAQSEINLLGQTVSEAIENVSQFLDQASLAGLKQVRIVHGFGTGRLREGLHRYFAKHPLIAEYRLGVYGEGEGGVTIVTLK